MGKTVLRDWIIWVEKMLCEACSKMMNLNLLGMVSLRCPGSISHIKQLFLKRIFKIIYVLFSRFCRFFWDWWPVTQRGMAVARFGRFHGRARLWRQRSDVAARGWMGEVWKLRGDDGRCLARCETQGCEGVTCVILEFRLDLFVTYFIYMTCRT